MKTTRRLNTELEGKYLGFSVSTVDGDGTVKLFAPGKVYTLYPDEAEEMAELFSETAAALREVARATRQNEAQNGNQANYQADNQSR